MKHRLHPPSGHAMTAHLLQIYHSIQKERKILKPPVDKKNPSALKKSQRRYYLGDSFPAIYFSVREAQCVALDFENKTNLEIANVLNISARTVEFYFNNIKAKLDIKNKPQIIERLKDTDFITAIPAIKSELRNR